MSQAEELAKRLGEASRASSPSSRRAYALVAATRAISTLHRDVEKFSPPPSADQILIVDSCCLVCGENDLTRAVSGRRARVWMIRGELDQNGYLCSLCSKMYRRVSHLPPRSAFEILKAMIDFSNLGDFEVGSRIIPRRSRPGRSDKKSTVVVGPTFRRPALKPLLPGAKFERWTVVCPQGHGPKGEMKYLCRCTCGTVREVLGHSLRSGGSKSCGCLALEIASQPKGLLMLPRKEEIRQSLLAGESVLKIAKRFDVSAPAVTRVFSREELDDIYTALRIPEGSEFGSLRVIRNLQPNRGRGGRYLCQCSFCGSEREFTGSALRKGAFRTCGSPGCVAKLRGYVSQEAKDEVMRRWQSGESPQTIHRSTGVSIHIIHRLTRQSLPEVGTS